MRGAKRNGRGHRTAVVAAIASGPVALLVAAGAAGASGGQIADRFEPANRCLAIASGSDYIAQAPDGYRAVANRAAAERFFFEPTGLGRYLIYDADRRLSPPAEVTGSSRSRLPAGRPSGRSTGPRVARFGSLPSPAPAASRSAAVMSSSVPPPLTGAPPASASCRRAVAPATPTPRRAPTVSRLAPSTGTARCGDSSTPTSTSPPTCGPAGGSSTARPSTASGSPGRSAATRATTDPTAAPT